MLYISACFCMGLHRALCSISIGYFSLHLELDLLDRHFFWCCSNIPHIKSKHYSEFPAGAFILRVYIAVRGVFFQKRRYMVMHYI